VFVATDAILHFWDVRTSVDLRNLVAVRRALVVSVVQNSLNNLRGCEFSTWPSWY
jgi:hypothetical protein